MKKTAVIMFLFLSVISPAFSSNSRVAQLGQAWLVPDEFTDVAANPAEINNVQSNLFIAGLGAGLYLHNWPTTIVGDRLSLRPGLSLIFRSDFLNLGLITASDYGYYFRDRNSTFEEDVQFILGKRVSEAISLGMGIFSYMSGLTGSPQSYQGFSAGMEYRAGTLGLGLNATAGGISKGAIDYMTSAGILADLKMDGEAMIRMINTVTYRHDNVGLTQNGTVNPFGKMYFGHEQTDMSTGISYSNAILGARYIISLVNNWNIYSYRNTGYYDNISFRRTGITINGDSINLNIGLETPVFAEWLLFRCNYNLLQLSYAVTGYIIVNSLNPEDTLDADVEFDAYVFPNFISGSGLGIKFGDNMSLDITMGFADSGFFHYYHKNRTFSDFMKYMMDFTLIF